MGWEANSGPRTPCFNGEWNTMLALGTLVGDKCVYVPFPES